MWFVLAFSGSPSLMQARKDLSRGFSVDSRAGCLPVMSDSGWMGRGRRCSSVADLEKHTATVAAAAAALPRRCHSAQSERDFEEGREVPPRIPEETTKHHPDPPRTGRRSSFFHRSEKSVSTLRRGSMPVANCLFLEPSPESTPEKVESPKKGKFRRERGSLLSMKRNSLPEPDGAEPQRACRRFSSSGGGRLESVSEGLMSALAPGVAYIAPGPPSRPTSPCAPKLRTPVWLLAMTFAELSGKSVHDGNTSL